MKKIISLLTVAMLLVCALNGCGGNKEAVATDGPTSMNKVIGALGEAFEADTGITVTYNATGSGAGIQAVQEGRCDIGLASRNLKDEEKANGLEGTILAYDGIAIIVNPNNPDSELDVETIAKIYTGEITNWKEVGGNDAEIVLIGREAGSGTRDGFESITDTEDKCKYRQELTSTGDVITTVASNVDKVGTEYFDNYNSSIFRFTLVSADGTVLYDSQATASDMENHLEREEIAEALESGNGSSARYSSTLTERTFYEATRLENGNVLRISVSQVTVGALILGMMPAIVAIILISAVVALVLSHKMAKDIVKPLNELDLENPAENETYEELAPILTKLNKQHKQITRQIRELRQKSDEFEQITASMNEGLVLLDKKGMVLNINAAAKKLFSADETAVGRDFLTLDRSTDMSRAIEKALDGKRAEFREERNGSEYQFVINRTESDGKTVGIVILCFDVTETAFAERNRKEFTANVSHELKTPLQSIIGSAELLENGLVTPLYFVAAS